MRRWGEAAAALAVVATALGADFAAGRECAAFYAQTAGACWLGTAFAALVFGLLVALTARLGRDGSAANLFMLLRRAPGGALGWIGCALYALILLLAGGALLDAAGRLGELALPLRHARAFGLAASLLLAGWLALGGGGGLRAAGAAFVAAMAAYACLLAMFGGVEALPGIPFVLELTLADNWIAALALGALHAAMCFSLCAGLALRAAARGARPAPLGLWSGAAFFALVFAGNAALRCQADEILALEVPFVALASGWGSAGFWASAGIIYLAAVTSLAGLLGGLLPEGWMLNSQKCPAAD